MKCEIIVDLQFGSTGKGAIANWLVKNEHYDASIRVQSIQAGHTIYFNKKPYKMRTIPCAWTNPNVNLILGPGCFIEKKLLLEEIEMINEAMGGNVRDRLYVDYRAFYIEDHDVEMEQGLDKQMGSTAHGAGASLIRKLWRKEKPTRVIDDDWAFNNGIKVIDTIEFIQKFKVLVEGCQGTLLGVHTSPYYPFVTSRESSAAGILSECGISPLDVTKIHGVFRTYPIRVGGNSGNTGGEEITWQEINRRAGRNFEPEITTVTKRIRRIFEFSHDDFRHALIINKPTNLYMTFADYLDADIYGKTQIEDLSYTSKMRLYDFISNIQDNHYIKINWIGTGEQEHHFIVMK